MDDILQKLKDTLVRIGIVLDDNFSDDVLTECIVDSVEFVSLLAELEDEFDIEFPDEYIDYSIIGSVEYLMSVISTLTNK